MVNVTVDPWGADHTDGVYFGHPGLSSNFPVTMVIERATITATVAWFTAGVDDGPLVVAVPHPVAKSTVTENIAGAMTDGRFV